jgi:hypothetical protein
VAPDVRDHRLLQPEPGNEIRLTTGFQSDTAALEPERRSRLESLDRSADLLPWRRAWELESCQLYWMPAASFPMPFRQRQWLLRFAQEFTSTIAAKCEVLPQLFLQMKIIHPDLRDLFIRTSRQFCPMMGLSRRPNSPLPAIPDEKYAQDLQKGKVQYDHKALQPDYCYWFVYPEREKQRELFLGYGGLTALYIRADAGNKPPKVEVPKHIRHDQRFATLPPPEAMQRVLDGAFALKSPFLARSKEMFAADLKEDPQYPGLLFVIPLLEARAFFQASPEQIESWFSLFDFYLHESPGDRGILLATPHDIESELIDLLARLRDAGCVYQE